MRGRPSVWLAVLISLEVACTREIADDVQYRVEPSARHVQFIISTDPFRRLSSPPGIGAVAALRVSRLPRSPLVRRRHGGQVRDHEGDPVLSHFSAGHARRRLVAVQPFRFSLQQLLAGSGRGIELRTGSRVPTLSNDPRLPSPPGRELGRGDESGAAWREVSELRPAYLEGAKAVYDHSYYNQADATMRYFLDIHERIARSADEKTPAFSNLLLAAADELSHLHGVTTSSPDGIGGADEEHCFIRGETIADEAIFRILDEDQGHLEQLESRYFTQVGHDPSSGEHQRLCVALPKIEGNARPHPDYVLAMILIDMELGFLIDRFRSIRFDSEGRRHFEPGEDDLIRFMRSPTIEDTLFERTLFVLFGDHGMVDTAPHDGSSRAGRQPGTGSALPERELPRLSERATSVTVGGRGCGAGPKYRAGIDYVSMPDRLSRPYRHRSWQSEEIRRVTTEASQWAKEFFAGAQGGFAGQPARSILWLFFLRSLLVDPRLDTALEPVVNPALDVLTKLYLRGESRYMEAEAAAIGTSSIGT